MGSCGQAAGVVSGATRLRNGLRGLLKMANLPTAYASQDFGRKTLDFYAASGEVSGSDPRARADERSLTDYDGAKHTVRVMDRNFALEAGDQASVLRMQTGPAQRSRPVALVNHTQKGWSRTHPGASALLSRAGVARNVNWFLTVLLFALMSLVMVWPALRAFLVEVDPGLFGAAPEFDLFALALAALPDLGNWSFAESVAPLSGLIAQAGPLAAEHADAIVFYGASGLGALIVFATRSWRLLWAPLFVGLVGAAALGLGGEADAAGYAVLAYGLAGLIFVVGGAINRVRDSARLERRIALLADHLERHPPEETIAHAEDPEAEQAVEPVVEESEAEDADASAANDDAPAAIAVPVSAALSEGEGEAAATADAEQATVADTDSEETSSAEADAEDAPAADADAPAVQPDETVAVDVDEAVLEDAEVADEPIEAEGAEPAPADAVLTEDPPEPVLSAPEAGDDEAVSEPATETAAGDAAPSEEPAAETVDEAAAEDPQTEVAEAASDDEVEPASEEAVAFEAESEADIETHADSDALTSEDAEELEPALTAAASSDPQPEEPEVELAGLDAEEAERLKNDPRYAARAIVLPSPPPMPAAEAESEADTAGDDAVAASKGPVTRETRELRPSAPLTSRVLSLFSNPPVPPAPPAPPAPERSSEDENV